MRLGIVTAAVLLGCLQVPAAADDVVTRDGEFAFADLCVFAFVDTGTTGESSEWSGVVYGGPLLVTAPEPAVPLPDTSPDRPVVTLTCSVHAEPSSGRHSAPALATVSGTGRDVVVVPPAPMTIVTSPGAMMWACSRVTVAAADGTTRELYWDGKADRFSTDPDVLCDLPETCTCHDGWYQLVEETYETVDATACPVTRDGPDQPGVVETRPDGDVHVLGQWMWDCPPYGG